MTKKKSNDFSARDVGVLIEDLGSQFKVFGEGLKDLQEKVNTIDGRTARLEKSVEDIQIKVTRLEVNSGRVFDVLSDHEKRIVKLEGAPSL